MKRLVAALLLCCALLASPAHAQDPRITGTIAALNSCVTLSNITDRSSAFVDVSGTFVAGLTTSVSVDNSNWRIIDAASISAPSFTTFAMDGARSVRVCATAYTSGTATVTINVGQGRVSVGYVSRSMVFTWSSAGYTMPGTMDLRGMRTLRVKAYGNLVVGSWDPNFTDISGRGWSMYSVALRRYPYISRFANHASWSGTDGETFDFPIPQEAVTLTGFGSDPATGSSTVLVVATNEPMEPLALALMGKGDYTLRSGGLMVGGDNNGGVGSFEPLRMLSGVPAGSEVGVGVSIVNASNAARSVLQGTSPWVVSGTVTANAGTGTFAASSTQLPAALAANGGLKIEGVAGGVAVPVSGTFWQATQPVSAASLPLPSGAATEATLSSLNGKVTTVDTGNVTVAASALPSGAATAANQATGNTSLGSIDTKTPALVSGRVPVDGSGVTQPVSGTFWQATQPVSAAALPLPSGAATSANQDLQIADLDNLSNATGIPDTGIGGGGATRSVLVAGRDEAGLQDRAFRIVSGTPGASEWGVVVRNVPTGTQTVSGTVTANAGTNLNTSALALDATLTGRLPAGASPADNESNTNTSLSRIGSFQFVFDGTTWDRWTGAVTLGAALPAGTNNIGDVDVLTVPALFTDRTQKTQITDGTRDGTIKAASTAAAAADTSLVVGLSPNSPIPAGTNNIGDVDVLTVPALFTDRTQKAQITDGTRDGTVKAASTAAAAADTSLVIALSPNSPLPTGSNTIGALSANQTVNVAQMGGTATSMNTGTRDAGTQRVTIATNDLVPVNQTQMNGVAVASGLGVSGTDTQRVTLSQESTYAASTAAKTATAAGTAAFFELCGSATKTVRIQRVAISGTVATAAIYGDIQLRKTSAAATGGTATTLTNTPYDSNSAAATVTAKFFTVLPTGGATLVGNIFSETAFFPITGTVANMTPQFIYAWRDTDAEPPTLRGTSQCITAGFGTTPTNAPTLSVSVAWTEK